MIEDYRKELTKSMRAQLDDNQDLKDALQQIKDDKQKMQDTMINHLRNDIEKDKIGQDQNYILNMSEQDLDNAGLSLKATRNINLYLMMFNSSKMNIIRLIHKTLLSNKIIMVKSRQTIHLS